MPRILDYSQTHNFLWKRIYQPSANDVEVIHTNGMSIIRFLQSDKEVYYSNLMGLLRYLDVNNLKVVKTNL